ncbi:MAG TPA: hypothetical protein VGG98_08415 [Solirubrobacteraceae bacterium]|jgi:hypothetical protein
MADTEEVDALPVLAGEPAVVRSYQAGGELTGRGQSGAVIPAVQAAAVAAGGFVAGAAMVGLVNRRRSRQVAALTRGRRAGRRLAGRGKKDAGGPLGELVQIVGSRSLLVDVHLLGSGGER